MSGRDRSDREFQSDRRLAWLALAAREPAAVAQVDIELLSRFIDGQCDAGERERVLQALADDPKLWRLWQALLDIAPAEVSVPATAQVAERSSWLRWLAQPAGMRWAAALGCIVLVSVLTLNVWPPSQPGWPAQATAWLQTGVEWRELAQVSVSRTRPLSGIRSIGEPTAPVAKEGAPFNAGFSQGMKAVADNMASYSEGWLRESERLDGSPAVACDRGDTACTRSVQAGYLHGAWALMTMTRCASSPASPEIQASFQELLAAQGAPDLAVPGDLPRERESRLACGYAERLLLRYAP